MNRLNALILILIAFLKPGMAAAQQGYDIAETVICDLDLELSNGRVREVHNAPFVLTGQANDSESFSMTGEIFADVEDLNGFFTNSPYFILRSETVRIGQQKVHQLTLGQYVDGSTLVSNSKQLVNEVSTDAEGYIRLRTLVNGNRKLTIRCQRKGDTTQSARALSPGGVIQ